jgi:hypothetical protein
VQTKTFIGKFLHNDTAFTHKLVRPVRPYGIKLGGISVAASKTFPNHVPTLQFKTWPLKTIWSHTSITSCCSKRQQWKLARFRALFLFRENNFQPKNCTSPSTSIPWRRPACHNFQIFCHIYPFYILRTLWLQLVTLTIYYNSTYLQSASLPSTTNCLETDTSHFINVSQIMHVPLGPLLL